MRAPGMSLNRIPLYVWAMLVTSFMIIFAMPSVMLASTSCSITDRARRHAFLQSGRRRRPAALAAPLLVLRPSRGLHHLHSRRSGFVSTIVATFCAAADVRLHRDRPVADRDRLHRRSACGCTTCSPRRCRELGQSFFTAASMLIAIPSGDSDLLLDRDDLGGPADSRRRCSSSLGFIVIFVHGRADRRDARLGPVRSAGP